MKKLERINRDFKNAFNRLKEAVQEAESDLEIDGVIQRFEFTFELGWKALMIYLQEQGIIARSPKSVLKEAYQLELISEEKDWLKMLEDRNRSVHIYDKETSREIYQRVKEKYVLKLEQILVKISEN